jgi:hypothetical protein
MLKVIGATVVAIIIAMGVIKALELIRKRINEGEKK